MKADVLRSCGFEDTVCGSGGCVGQREDPAAVEEGEEACSVVLASVGASVGRVEHGDDDGAGAGGAIRGRVAGQRTIGPRLVG